MPGGGRLKPRDHLGARRDTPRYYPSGALAGSGIPGRSSRPPSPARRRRYRGCAALDHGRVALLHRSAAAQSTVPLATWITTGTLTAVRMSPQDVPEVAPDAARPDPPPASTAAIVSVTATPIAAVRRRARVRLAVRPSAVNSRTSSRPARRSTPPAPTLIRPPRPAPCDARLLPAAGRLYHLRHRHQ